METLDLVLDAAAPLHLCLKDLSPDFNALLSANPLTEDGDSGDKTLSAYVDGMAAAVQTQISAHRDNIELAQKIATLVALTTKADLSKKKESNIVPAKVQSGSATEKQPAVSSNVKSNNGGSSKRKTSTGKKK